MGLSKAAVQDNHHLVTRRHDRASADYNEWRRMCDEVAEVYKGEYDVPKDLDGSTLEVSRPSDGMHILRKMEQMIAIRSEKVWKVYAHSDTDREQRRVDKIERWLRGYMAEHAYITQEDWFRSLAWFALYRGRGGAFTLYEPNADTLKLIISPVDTYDVYPVYGKRGVRYVTTERWMLREDLEDYFAGLPDAQRPEMAGRVLYPAPEDEADYQFVRVVQYWDDEIFAWLVDDTLIDVQEHGYGFCPYDEARFNRTPLDEQRWASMGVLAGVMDELKGIASLRSKMMTGTELFYFPILLYRNRSGALVRFDPYAKPGTFQEMDEGFDPIILNPQVNHEALQLLEQSFQNTVGKGTLPEITYVSDVPNVSGFLVSQFLSIIQDALSDMRDGLEMSASRIAGNLLKLAETFADEQDDGMWEVPADSGVVEKLTTDDIDGHYRVRVKVKVALPQDKLQYATIFNQLYQPDPLTGAPRIDIMTALEISGLQDVIEDTSGMVDRVEMERLFNTDEESKGLYVAYMKARHADKLRTMQRDVEKQAKREERREQRQAEREIEKGLSEDVLLPAEIATNPQQLQQFVALIQQGQTPQIALKMLTEGGGLPMGAPGQPSQQPGGDMQALFQELFGQGAQVAQQPDGLTGYDNGIAPAALPPAMQGAQPRQSVDQAGLFVEDVEEDQRRGALPAPR